jgi:high affinity Mn2+ porin
MPRRDTAADGARPGRPGRGRLTAILLAIAFLLLAPGHAAAQRGAAAPIYQQNIDALITGAEDWLARIEEQGWFLRGQMTTIVQGHPAFRARTSGENSLGPRREGVLMQTIDLVIGRRLWHNAEIVAVPSPTRGYGFSNNRGLGSPLNGDAFHAGTNAWDFNLARLFIRQTFEISEDTQGVDDDPMRFTGPLARERVTVTAGKFAVWDFFDNNRYAHDPRTQFLSYALVGTGAIDTAGDPAGYNYGAVLEWENGTWATRLGAFQVARSQGGDYLDAKILQGHQILFEVDRFWQIGRHPGALRLLVGNSRTNSSRYDALTTALATPEADPAALRAYRNKPMLGLSLEQRLNDSVGVFARLGWANGQAQRWMFTEMDWSISAGLSVNGGSWDRPNDILGLAFNIGGLHGPQKRFYKAGGYGFMVGDGQLSYAAEVVGEAYYQAELVGGLALSGHLQMVANPGYNSARGPLPAGSLRLRVAF